MPAALFLVTIFACYAIFWSNVDDIFGQTFAERSEARIFLSFLKCTGKIFRSITPLVCCLVSFKILTLFLTLGRGSLFSSLNLGNGRAESDSTLRNNQNIKKKTLDTRKLVILLKNGRLS